MRRLTLMLLGCLLPVLVLAQGQQERLKIKYSCEFRQDGKSYKTDGVVLTQGGAFMLTADGLKVYNDGATMWVIDQNAKEVTIEQGSTQDFISNPLQALPLFGFNSQGASVQTLTDASGRLQGYDITLRSTDKVILRIKKIETLDGGPSSDFSFDRSKLSKDYVVSDMR